MSYSTIYVKLRSPTGKLVEGQIIIRDGFALATFSDPKLARQLYEEDLTKGEDVAFNEKHNAYVQKYEGMKKAQIIKKLKQELQASGGEVIEK